MLNAIKYLLTKSALSRYILLLRQSNTNDELQIVKHKIKGELIMKNLRNSVHLIGRLGMDPEVKSFDNNKKVARFSLATDESYKNAKGEKVEETQWHNLVVWGSQATVAEKFLKKGKEIMIEGRLTTRKWESEKEGTKYITEIIVNDILMLGGK